MVENQAELKQFLIEAKQNTYAAGAESTGSSRPQSRDIHYSAGSYLYIDSSIGSRDFVGQEVVWKDGEAVWAMNYYGRIWAEEVPDGFEQCLKQALMNLPADAPFRGPRTHRCDHLEYRSGWKGDLDGFIGGEEMLYYGNKIYELTYHGGIII